MILGEDMTNENAERIRGMVLKRNPPVPVVATTWDAIHSKFALVDSEL